MDQDRWRILDQERWVDTVDGKVGGYSRWVGGWIQ